MDTPLTKDLLKDLVKHADELTLEQIKRELGACWGDHR